MEFLFINYKVENLRHLSLDAAKQFSQGQIALEQTDLGDSA